MKVLHTILCGLCVCLSLYERESEKYIIPQGLSP